MTRRLASDPVRARDLELLIAGKHSTCSDALAALLLAERAPSRSSAAAMRPKGVAPTATLPAVEDESI